MRDEVNGFKATGPVRRALVALTPEVLAGGIGAAATLPNVRGWYAGLAKPAFTPPDAAFGPAWTILYLLMALAFYRVLALALSPARRAAIVAFLVQMALNGAWSVAFFGLHSPTLGLLVIAALIVSMVVAMTRLHVVDRPAAVLLVPTFAWVLFAATLNAAIWLMNR